MQRDTQDRNKRLASYSSAAALGVFSGLGGTAEAEIIYTDLEPDLVTEAGGAAPNINLDNAGYAEVVIVTTGTNIQIRDYANVGNVLTNSATSGYYVRGFDAGNLIGPSSLAASDTGSHVAAGGPYSANFFAGANKFIGVQFIVNGATHYGWVGYEIDSVNPLHGIVRDYAYETTPDTAIVAGQKPVPEPGSLALLAAGAGALAVSRRRQSA